MKEELMTNIEQEMMSVLDNAQMEQLHKTLKHCLENVEIKIKENEMDDIYDYTNIELINSNCLCKYDFSIFAWLLYFFTLIFLRLVSKYKSLKFNKTSF